MSFKSNLLPLLSNDGLTFGLYSRNSKGQIVNRITQEGDIPQDVVDELASLGLIKNEDGKYLIEVQSMFMYFADEISKIIKNEHSLLYRRLIVHKQRGVMRDFKVNYPSIREGNLDSSSTLSRDLSHVFPDIFEEFQNIYGEFSYHYNDDGRKLNDLNNKFSVLIQFLLMSIVVEYVRKEDKNNFKNNIVFEDDIKSIKNNITTLLNRNHGELDDLLVFSFYSSSNFLERYICITGEEVNAEDLLEIIHPRIGNHSSYMKIDKEFSNDTESYYSSLLDMLGKINMVEEFYNQLIESCSHNNGSEAKSSKQLLSLIVLE